MASIDGSPPNEIVLHRSSKRSYETSPLLSTPCIDGKSPCLPALLGTVIKVANSRPLREKAYRLAFSAYRERNYATSQGKEWIVAAYDRRPDTLTLLAEDASGKATGTITIVYDGPESLPCDEIFREELAELRGDGRRIVEVTRLATNASRSNSRILLIRLFNWIYIHARLLRNHDDFVIEVNPRHVEFYRKLLGFEVLGRTRPCPRVQGAPAALLRLDLSYAERETARLAGYGAGAGERTLYAHFLGGNGEKSVLGHLRRNCSTMNYSDLLYFGLDDRAQAEIAAAL